MAWAGRAYRSHWGARSATSEASRYMPMRRFLVGWRSWSKMAKSLPQYAISHEAPPPRTAARRQAPLCLRAVHDPRVAVGHAQDSGPSHAARPQRRRAHGSVVPALAPDADDVADHA